MQIKGDLKKIKELPKTVSSAVQYILERVWQNVLLNNAKINAPYLSGDLSDSLTLNFNKIQEGIIIVGSSLPYAKIREYVNNKHPWRLFYLWRAYSEHIPEIREIIVNSLSEKLK